MEIFKQLQTVLLAEMGRRKEIIKRMDQLEERLEKLENKVFNQSKSDLVSEIERSLETIGVDTKGLKYRREDLYRR